MSETRRRVTALTGLRRTRFLIPQYKIVGTGASGVAIRVKDGLRTLQYILSHHRVEDMAFGESMRAGQPVVLKIVKCPPGLREFYRNEVQREVNIMSSLLASRPTRIGDKTFDIRQYIPHFFASGYVADLDLWFIAMSHAPGYLLGDLNSLSLSVEMIVRLEHAYLSMWLAGCGHADLHTGNILVAPNGRITIIDFGRAVRLSTSTVREVRKELMGVSAKTLASTRALKTLAEPVDRDIWLTYGKNKWYRTYRQYLNGNSSVSHVRKLCDRQPRCRRELLPAVRQMIWAPTFLRK